MLENTTSLCKIRLSFPNEGKRRRNTKGKENEQISKQYGQANVLRQVLPKTVVQLQSTLLKQISPKPPTFLNNQFFE